jgi:hypothetical protein
MPNHEIWIACEISERGVQLLTEVIHFSSCTAKHSHGWEVVSTIMPASNVAVGAGWNNIWHLQCKNILLILSAPSDFSHNSKLCLVFKQTYEKGPLQLH